MRIADAVETAVIACKISGAKTDADALKRAVTDVIWKIRTGRVIWADNIEIRNHHEIEKTIKYKVVSGSGEQRTLNLIEVKDPFNETCSNAYIALNSMLANARIDLIDATQRTLDMLGYDITDNTLWEFCIVRGKGHYWDNVEAYNVVSGIH